jgi:hypothetical protein
MAIVAFLVAKADELDTPCACSDSRCVVVALATEHRPASPQGEVSSPLASNAAAAPLSLRAGMGVRHVNVGAVLNIQSDHLGIKGIDTLEQLAEVKRVVVEVATDCAVLNADDPHVLRMSGYTEATACADDAPPDWALVRTPERTLYQRGTAACLVRQFFLLGL